MSSFPQHVKNIDKLEELGFDVSEYSEDPYESWSYDDLVYLVQDLITQLERFEENSDVKLKDGL